MSKTLEQRVRELEDRMEIYQLVCEYGYAVDGCNADAVGSLYAPDGVYAVGDVGAFEGRDRIAAITSAPGHRAMVEAGCGHISTLPYVVIQGDRASATCHTMLIKKMSADGYVVARLSASRLELSRNAQGRWQIDHRQNWQLDGGTEGPDLLARLNEPPQSA